jgi:hypothetical protein
MGRLKTTAKWKEDVEWQEVQLFEEWLRVRGRTDLTLKVNLTSKPPWTSDT